LGVSLAFCVLLFVYLEIMLNRRLANPRAVFETDYRHYESLYDYYLLIPGVFLLAQIWFILGLWRAQRRQVRA
jgi:hypothetical protein